MHQPNSSFQEYLVSLKEFLDSLVDQMNNTNFIKNDPISIPHQFSIKEDIEISGFLTALISWGNRSSILKSANHLMQLMEFSPFQFIVNSSEKERYKILKFYYRTLNSDDLLFLMNALQNIYQKHGGLERIANKAFEEKGEMKDVIIAIRNSLLETPHFVRSEKHLADPQTGSAAKRINMFLRWMIRQDLKGVDFGIWKTIPKSMLMCPLDLHSGMSARKLNLLSRKNNDWKAVEELTINLRILDKNDPVKYDFALFGIGINK